MLSIQTPESGAQGYGLGFSLRRDGDGNRWASHGGSVAGYTAHLVFNPDPRLGAVLLRKAAAEKRKASVRAKVEHPFLYYNDGRTNLVQASLDLARRLQADRASEKRRGRSPGSEPSG